MNRGELYLVRKAGSQDPAQATRFRVLRFTPVTMASVLRFALALMSLLKSALTHYVGSLKGSTLRELDHALKASMELEDRHPRPNGA